MNLMEPIFLSLFANIIRMYAIYRCMEHFFLSKDENKISLNLGRSKGYIQSISSGRSLPSMNTFLDICDYFHLTPREFFSPEITNPSLLHEVISNLETCSEDDLILINEILLRLKKNES